MRTKMPLVVSLAVLLVVSTSLLAATAAGDARFEVLSDSGSRITVQFRAGGFDSEPVTIDGRDFVQLRMAGEPVSFEKGAPALPFASRSLIVPDDAQMAVRVLASSYREMTASIAPSRGILLRSVDPASVPHTFGDVYVTDAFYPASLASLGEPYILRDHRAVTLRIDPFRYNPVTGVLRVYDEIVVEVAAVGPARTNRLERRQPRASVRPFRDIYGSRFLNYGSIAAGEDYDPLDEQGDMLIIAHDAWISSFDPFVTHKASMGITATVVGVSTIGNDAVSIKSYIQNLYDTSDLAFVLLAGDSGEVATPIASGGASDPSYAKLAGADDYPDILVGRFSARTLAQLETQIERTIEYESLPALGQAWFKRGTGVASAEGAGIGDEGQSDKVHMSEIRGWLLADDYTLVDEIYDPGATAAQVSNAVNAGRGAINYCGHGSATSWGTTGFSNANVNALVNDNMLPFIFSVACNNGEFNHYDACYAEAWLRATNGGEPTGAIAMYGSSILQSWAPPMEAQDEFNLLLTDVARPYRSYGALAFAASCSMMDAYLAAGVEMYDTWNLFGDPSLLVVGDPGTGLGVTPEDGLSGSGPAGGPIVPTSLVYTLRNREDEPLDYEVRSAESWVAITNATGTIEPGGAAQVTVAFNDGTCDLDNGDHTGVVEFVNLTAHVGDTSRPVSAAVGMRTVFGQWTFDSDPGWSVEGEWAYGVPEGGGGGHGYNADPTSGASGSTVYGVNLAGDFNKAPGGPYYLTLGPIDMTGLGDVTLSFERWLNSAGLPDVSSMVEASSDGSAWTTLWTSSAAVTDAAWTPQSLDLSTVADDRGAVYLRWGYQVLDRAPKVGSGWNIDDVALECLPDSAKVRLSVDAGSLSWTDLPAAVGFDVVQGDLSTLAESGGNYTPATGSCLEDDLAATSLDHSALPEAGEGFWFLVRGVCGAGPMTYQALEGHAQQGVRDAEIDASPAACD